MKIVCRKANKNDNILKICELIYNVDPYIYPYWFENLRLCKEELSKLILDDGFVFNINNIYIAVDDDSSEIVGLVSIASFKTNLDYDYDMLIKYNERYNYTINNYILPMIEQIANNKTMCVTNFCVDKNYRNHNIGTNLLKYALDDNLKDFENIKITFDVLANNESALRVYEKLGFRQEGNIELGFNGEGMIKPDVVIVSRYKGEINEK